MAATVCMGSIAVTMIGVEVGMVEILVSAGVSAFMGFALGGPVWWMEWRQGRRDPSVNFLRALVRPTLLLGIGHCVASMFLALNFVARLYQPIPEPIHPVVFTLTIVLLLPLMPCLLAEIGLLLLPFNSLIWIIAMRAIGRRIIARRRSSNQVDNDTAEGSA